MSKNEGLTMNQLAEINAQHVTTIAALEAKCAALAAKGMEVVREASLIYSKYNDTQMPDRDIVDQQTLQELYEICTADDGAAFLAEVRAQGVDAAIEHLHKRFEGTGQVGVPVMVLESLAAQLRQGAAQ